MYNDISTSTSWVIVKPTITSSDRNEQMAQQYMVRISSINCFYHAEV